MFEIPVWVVVAAFLFLAFFSLILLYLFLRSSNENRLLEKEIEELVKENQEHVNKIKELTTLSTIDPLTGLLNRREYPKVFNALAGLLSGGSDRSTDRRHSLSSIVLLVLDLDYFKTINDTFSHSMGDEVLRVVSSTVRKLIRDKDPVCRWGGEEIVVALPGMSEADAMTMAEKIRAAIEKLQFSRDEVRVTVSIGVACAYNSSDAKEVFGWADQAVYKAKHKGRNRVSLYSGVND